MGFLDRTQFNTYWDEEQKLKDVQIRKYSFDQVIVDADFFDSLMANIGFRKRP